MCLILFLYVRIALVLHRSSRNGSLRRCCATQHQPNYVPNSSNQQQQQVIGFVLNNGTQMLGSPQNTLNNYNNPYNSKRTQAERAHIQSRRAVIRMLGK